MYDLHKSPLKTMVSPDSEPLNALEVVKLTVFLRSLTPPLSQICLFSGIYVPCSCSQMHERDPLLISRSHPPDHSIPVITQLFTRSVFVASEEITPFLYPAMSIMEIRLILAHYWFCILFVFISFTFSYNVFQAFIHQMQHFLSFFL